MPLYNICVLVTYKYKCTNIRIVIYFLCMCLTLDRDRSGEIEFTEFLVGMRGPLNDRRKGFVKQAFDILDLDRSGTITVEEIQQVVIVLIILYIDAVYV